MSRSNADCEMLNSGMDEVENRVHSGRHLMPWKIIKKKYAERYFVFERFFVIKVTIKGSIWAQMLSILVSFLCHTTKSTTRKIMKREYRGLDDVLREQESRFPSLFGSGNKILTKITRLFTKRYVFTIPLYQLISPWSSSPVKIM